MKIAILSGASPSWNPRVVKEAAALARAGFDVMVLGVSLGLERWESDRNLARQYGYRYRSVAPRAGGGFYRELLRFLPRLQNRSARMLGGAIGVEGRWQLGANSPNLLRFARASGAEYFIVHLEEAVWAGRALLKEGLRVGCDLEDWYSEDLLPEARRHRPVRLLRELESVLLARGSHVTCPSSAMSRAIADDYECSTPGVIYNAFPWAERALIDGLSKDRGGRQVPSIHWFSQTLGADRGLDDLLGALPLVPGGVEIHLRGRPARGFEDWLRSRVPEEWNARVFVHGLVPHNQLLSRIAEHDIGFAGEMKYCRNKDVTVSNKILQYLLAGLAVVASDTAGQREVAAQAPGATLLYPSGDAGALAQKINFLLGSREGLRAARAAALAAAQRKFCWERQEPVLLNSVSRALGLRTK